MSKIFDESTGTYREVLAQGGTSKYLISTDLRDLNREIDVPFLSYNEDKTQNKGLAGVLSNKFIQNGKANLDTPIRFKVTRNGKPYVSDSLPVRDLRNFRDIERELFDPYTTSNFTRFKTRVPGKFDIGGDLSRSREAFYVDRPFLENKNSLGNFYLDRISVSPSINPTTGAFYNVKLSDIAIEIVSSTNMDVSDFGWSFEVRDRLTGERINISSSNLNGYSTSSYSGIYLKKIKPKIVNPNLDGEVVYRIFDLGRPSAPPLIITVTYDPDIIEGLRDALVQQYNRNLRNTVEPPQNQEPQTTQIEVTTPSEPETETISRDDLITVETLPIFSTQLTAPSQPLALGQPVIDGETQPVSDTETTTTSVVDGKKTSYQSKVLSLDPFTNTQQSRQFAAAASQASSGTDSTEIVNKVKDALKRELTSDLVTLEFDVLGISFDISEQERYLKYSIVDDSGNISPMINWVRGGDLQQVSSEIDVLDSVVAKLPNPLPVSIGRLDVVDIFNTPFLPIEIGVDLSEDEGRIGVLQLTPNFRTDLEDNLINNYSDYKNFNSLTLSGSNDIQKNVIDYYLQREKGKIKLNTDFTDFQNFVKFSSAEERINNFFYKVQLLETYTSQSTAVSSSTASPIYKATELEKLDDNIRLVKTSFDDYEYFLYNDSGSFYSSSFVPTSDGIYASWLKTTSEESIVNGDFASSVSWSFDGGAQLVDETLLLEDSSTVTQSVDLTSGIEHTLSFEAFSGKQALNISYNGVQIIGNNNLIAGGSPSNATEYTFNFIVQDGDLSNDFIITSLLNDKEVKLDNLSIKPKPSLLSSNSTEVKSWYNGLVQIARDYDNRNRDSFRNNTPEYIREDVDSSDYVLFVDMIGQLFDEIWLHGKELSQLYNWNNDITKGLSEDLSLILLNMYANNLDTGFSEKDIWEYILGLDNNVAEIGGLQTNFSFEKQQKQTIRRLLTNLPHLLKHKGTRRAIESLVRSYGIPESTLFIKEFGSFQSPDGIEQQSQKRTSTYYLDFDGGGNNYLTLNDGSISQSRAVEFNLAFDANNASTQTFFYATGSTPNGYFTIGAEYESDENGKLVLDIVSGSDTFQLSSSIVPLYNGDFWNILVQKTDDADYEIRLNQFDRTDGEFNYQITSQSTVPLSIYSGIDTVFEDIDEFYFGEYSTLSMDFEGALDELRIWGTSLTSDNFDEHTKYPQSIKLNNALTIPTELKVRVDIENEWKATTGGSSGYLPNLVFNPTYPTRVSAVGFTEANWVNYIRVDYFGAPNVGDTKLGNNKVRYDITQTLQGDTLTPSIGSDESNETLTEVNDVNELIIGFSPTDVINQIIIQHFGDTDLVNEYGNPLESRSFRYAELSNLVEDFFSNISENKKAKFFIQYIRNFDKTLLNNIKKFVPEKANLTTGIFIEPHYLDRSKAPRLSRAETAELGYGEGTQIPPPYSLTDDDPDRTAGGGEDTGYQTSDNGDNPIEALAELTELERFLGNYLSVDLDEDGQANVILSQDEVGRFLNQDTNIIILDSKYDDYILYNDFDENGLIVVRNQFGERFVFEIRKFDYKTELADLENEISLIDSTNRDRNNTSYEEITRKYENLKKLDGNLFLIKSPYSGTKPGVEVTADDRSKALEYLIDLGVVGEGTVTTTPLEIDGVTYFVDDSPTTSSGGGGGTTGGEGSRSRNRVVVTNPDEDIKLTVE